MKYYLTLILITTYLCSVCQNDSSDYLDMYLDVTEKREAVYERVLTPLDEQLFEAEIISLDGKTKAKGVYFVDDGELVPHGNFIFFHSNGKIESEGRYKMGYKVDTWKRYEPNGNEKSPKYYQVDFGNLIESLSE